MTYIVSVAWGDSLDRPDLAKNYEFAADSPLGAIAEFKKWLGYNPGVPVKAREKETSVSEVMS